MPSRCPQDIQNIRCRMESEQWKFDSDDAQSVYIFAKQHAGAECIYYQPQDISKGQVCPEPALLHASCDSSASLRL